MKQLFNVFNVPTLTAYHFSLAHNIKIHPAVSKFLIKCILIENFLLSSSCKKKRLKKTALENRFIETVRSFSDFNGL